MQPNASVVRGAVAGLPRGSWLLAVSGGRDSMVLLDALATEGRADVRGVATFDHGTGPAAHQAVALVERTCVAHGFAFITGRMAPSMGRATEATWREARWRFLARHARELGAAVVTAHTRDDQVETVAMRIVRGAGARGLAGMSRASAGPPSVVRPFLEVTRADVDAYAREAGLEFVDDPSNLDRTHARNRMRHELLPALERVQPGFRDWLLELSRRSREWRDGVEGLVDDLAREGHVARRGDGSVVVQAAPLASLGPGEWRVLWPALAARAGMTLDRRGVARAADWASVVAGEARVRGGIQLAGGGTIERTRGAFVLRRLDPRGNAVDPAAAIY